VLHHEKELFEDLILRASQNFGIDTAIIEKDYYVSLLLAEIKKNVPNVIFKGGTSLSKCYHLIDRFSEDIDISVFETNKPTEGQRRNLKEKVIASVETLGFTLDNPDEIRSRREFNRYVISYPTVFEASAINQKLIVETAAFIGIYPTEEREAGNYLYEYIEQNDLLKKIDSEIIKPFRVKVQSLERTFVDKVFALGDYYLAGTITEHSRHIYDLYRLLEVISLDTDLAALAAKVREERKGHKTCLSAQDGIDMNTLLLEIAGTDAFKADYESVTYYLLFKKVSYEEAKTALIRIVDAGIFNSSNE